MRTWPAPDGPKALARHHRDLLLAQQALGELVRGQAGRRDVAGRRRRRRAARTFAGPMALRPSTSSRRRRSYSATIRWTAGSPAWSAARAASCATVGADMIPYWWTLTIPSRIPAGRAHPADPPAGHRVGLREAAHQDRPLAHARQRAERAVAVRAVGEAVVDLVAVHEQVVALGDPGELVLDVVVEDGAGRVGRVAQEQRLGARRDRGLDGGRVQREVVLERGSRRGGRRRPRTRSPGRRRRTRARGGSPRRPGRRSPAARGRRPRTRRR